MSSQANPRTPTPPPPPSTQPRSTARMSPRPQSHLIGRRTSRTLGRTPNARHAPLQAHRDLGGWENLTLVDMNAAQQDDTGSITTSSTHDQSDRDAALTDGSQSGAAAGYSGAAGASGSHGNYDYAFMFGGQPREDESTPDGLDGYELSRSSRAASPSPITMVNPQQLMMPPHAHEQTQDPGVQEAANERRSNKRQRTEKDEDDDIDAAEAAYLDHQSAADAPPILGSPFSPPGERKQPVQYYLQPPPQPEIADGHQMALPPPYPTMPPQHVLQHQQAAGQFPPVPQPQTFNFASAPANTIEQQTEQPPNFEAIVHFLSQENNRLRMAIESLALQPARPLYPPHVADPMQPSINDAAAGYGNQQEGSRPVSLAPRQLNELAWAGERGEDRSPNASVHTGHQREASKMRQNDLLNAQRRWQEQTMVPMGPNRAPPPMATPATQFTLNSNEWRATAHDGEARQGGMQTRPAHTAPRVHGTPPAYHPMDIDGAGRSLAAAVS
ncbi:hypothetical protein TRAPUB_10758, partial [Trametes pubescens]